MRNPNFSSNGKIEFAFDEVSPQVLKSWCTGDLCKADRKNSYRRKSLLTELISPTDVLNILIMVTAGTSSSAEIRLKFALFL